MNMQRGRFACWVRHTFTRRCTHPSNLVRADILEGDFHGGPGGEQSVEWCPRCGAYRRVSNPLDPTYRRDTEWRLPYA